METVWCASQLPRSRAAPARGAPPPGADGHHLRDAAMRVRKRSAAVRNSVAVVAHAAALLAQGSRERVERAFGLDHGPKGDFATDHERASELLRQERERLRHIHVPVAPVDDTPPPIVELGQAVRMRLSAQLLALVQQLAAEANRDLAAASGGAPSAMAAAAAAAMPVSMPTQPHASTRSARQRMRCRTTARAQPRWPRALARRGSRAYAPA